MRFHRNAFSREGYQVFLLLGLLHGAITDFDLGLDYDGESYSEQEIEVGSSVIFDQYPNHELIYTDEYVISGEFPEGWLVADTDRGCGAPICSNHPYVAVEPLPEGTKYEPGIPGKVTKFTYKKGSPKVALPCIPGLWYKTNYTDEQWAILEPFINHAPTLMYNLIKQIRKTFYNEGIEYADNKTLEVIVFRWLNETFLSEFWGPQKPFIAGRAFDITRNKLVDLRRAWDEMVMDADELAEERRVRRAYKKKDRDPLEPIINMVKERNGLHFHFPGLSGKNSFNQEDSSWSRPKSLTADVLEEYMTAGKVPAFIWSLIKPLVFREIFADIFCDPFYNENHRREVLMLCYGQTGKKLKPKEVASRLGISEKEMISIRKSAAEHMRTYVSRRPALQARVKMIDHIERYATEGTSLYAREVFNAYLYQQDQKEIWLPGADRLREFWAKEDYTQDED